jgi:hypothetical protein
MCVELHENSHVATNHDSIPIRAPSPVHAAGASSTVDSEGGDLEAQFRKPTHASTMPLLPPSTLEGDDHVHQVAGQWQPEKPPRPTGNHDMTEITALGDKVRPKWKSPLLMFTFFLVGVGMSIGHIIAYTRLDSEVVGDAEEQEVNFR